MKILGIETSCDETAVSVLDINPPSHSSFVKTSKDKKAPEGTVRVLSNTISSQVKLHAKYGGVVPNLAAREHVKNIRHVLKLALKEASKNGRWKMESGKLPVDLIAVTRGPGLGPALLVGIAFAKTLAWKYNKPLIGVNHLEGHIYSNWLRPIRVISRLESLSSKQALNPKDQKPKTFPILNLIVSGGHTELVLMEDYGKYKIVGETLDDAVGEAFDKVARLLGLGYPGGPVISQRAAKWNFQFPISNFQKNHNLQIQKIEFPRPMIKSKDYNFSYSGLKTAVLYKIHDLEKEGVKLTSAVKNEICYEFQKAAVDVLIQKTIRAAKEYKAKSVFLSGGVSANKYLRTRLAEATKEIGITYHQPELEYTGDNAAMIALAGYMNIKHQKSKVKTDWESVEMDANLGF